MDYSRFLACFVFWGSCFVTIDRGAKYRISGASATPDRKEHTILLGLLLYFSFSVVKRKKHAVRTHMLCTLLVQKLGNGTIYCQAPCYMTNYSFAPSQVPLATFSLGEPCCNLRWVATGSRLHWSTWPYHCFGV